MGAGRVTGVRTSPEVEAEVMALYEQGVTWREIMARTKRTEHTVQAIIKRNGGDLNRKVAVSPADLKRIPVLYRSGMDAPQIGRTVGCSTSMVYYVLDQAGLERRGRGCDNSAYFDQIDTPSKAYWLGFISADGCVTGFNSGNPRLVIKLARKDREHLTILHKELQANHPVRDHDEFSLGKSRPCSSLAVYSPVLVAGLVSQGIVARKTDSLQPWTGAAHLMPHYWRGLIDGDGSITINDKGVYVSFTGSEALVRGFLAWAHETCGTNSQPRQGTAGNGHYWTTQIGGTVRVLRLLAALYDDAPTALTRKKALADLAVHGKPLQGAIF